MDCKFCRCAGLRVAVSEGCGFSKALCLPDVRDRLPTDSQKIGVVRLKPAENVSVCSHMRVRNEHVGRNTTILTV